MSASLRPVGDLLVLCYHAVSDSWPAPLSVTPEALDAQLGSLVRRGYHGRRFTEAVTKPSMGRTLVVTFDDGYRSVLDRAKPILDRHGIPGTLFVPTDWPSDPRPMRWDGIDRWLGTSFEPELTQLRWDELRSLVEDGWEIGSHTCSHPRLTSVDDEALARELVESKSKVELELGLPCTSIAYPYGDVDARVETATASAGYGAAAALPKVMHRPRPLCWPRTALYHRDTTPRFRVKASRLVRSLRASAAGSAIDARRVNRAAGA